MERIKAVLTDNSIFRRCYIICLFLCNVSFVQIVTYVGLVLLFIWAIFLLIYNEIKKHTFQKTRYGAWLLAYLVFTIVTAFIHINDNFFYNIVIELHIAICFFLFYSVHTEKHLNFRRELYSICRFVVYATTVIGVVGLAFLMAGISFELWWVKFIVYENRFTGLYTNPNILGFTSVVAVFCCHMLCKKDFVTLSGKDRVSRIWLAFCLAINAVSLFLCDSNAALVLMVCYCIFFVLYKMFGAERTFSKKQIVTKIIACALAGAFIVGMVFCVRFVCQSGMSEIMERADIITETVNDDDNEQQMFAATSRITFTHENKNLDSGRLKLLRQAASLFSDFPLFGIGKGNIYNYGEEKFDNGIAFSDLYGKELAQFVTDFHNGYAMILVCSGIVGFVIFSIFGLRFAKHISIYVFKDENLKESILPCMYSFLCAYLVYAFFEKALLYDVSFTVLFFWLIMGYVSCFLCKYEPDHSQGISIFKRRIRKTLV